MAEPLITVAIPTFNRMDRLRIALESVRAQDYRNLEILVSDNASTDDTRLLCERLATEDPRITYLRHDKNRGAFANYSYVLHRATGEYFMWLGDDDNLHQSYLSRCVDVLANNLQVTLVAGGAQYTHLGEVVNVGATIELSEGDARQRVKHYFEQVTENGVFYGLMRRLQALSIPLRPSIAADWLFVASLAFKGRVVTIPEVPIFRDVGDEIRRYESRSGTLVDRAITWFRGVRIAWVVLIDIGLRSPVYAVLGSMGRLALGIKCSAVTLDRSVVPAMTRRLRLISRLAE